MTTFRIATFVNDREQYEEMRSSFEAAGFLPPLARFTIEQGEPYDGIARLGQTAEPFVVLVHQDVRCDWGDTATSLMARLAELTTADPDWVVAGNAGYGSAPMRGLAPIRHLSDPHGTSWATGLPQKVLSLDENLLILRTEKHPTCSPELSGWHLYGTDVVLNAALTGGSGYVVDFRVTHLSGGNARGYEEARSRFVEHWRRRCRTEEPGAPAALDSVGGVLSALERIGGSKQP